MYNTNLQTHPGINNIDFVKSYLLLRQGIGVLGISLPFVLMIGGYFIGPCQQVQPSISHYYYSVMHIWFVGTLCVLGGLLISYRGRNKFENIVSNCAGAFAFGVAIFPTGFDTFRGDDWPCRFIQFCPNIPGYVEKVHFTCAGLLFLCFAIFCFVFFQKPDSDISTDLKKIRRNKFYKFCGWAIVVSIAFIGYFFIFGRPQSIPFINYSTLIFETTSLLFFGSSWLLKGSLDWPRSKHKLIRFATSHRYEKEGK